MCSFESSLCFLCIYLFISCVYAERLLSDLVSVLNLQRISSLKTHRLVAHIRPQIASTSTLAGSRPACLPPTL